MMPEKEQVVVDSEMKKKYRNGETWEFENDIDNNNNNNSNMSVSVSDGVLLGLDGGTTSTVCICMPMIIPFSHSQLQSLPILSRAVAGCSNHNSIGGYY
jgi:hypothetical protein